MRKPISLLLALVATMVACTPTPSDRSSADMVVLDTPVDSATGLDAPEIATEVADGVLVVPAPMLPGVVRLHLASGQQDTVGRAGDGPGEFRAPFYVQSLNHGEVLVLDALARRVTILDSSLTFKEQFTDFGGLAPSTLRFDTLGNSYSVAAARGAAAPGDSQAVVRRRPNATTHDTVAFIGRLELHELQFGTNYMMVPAEYAPRDVWGVYPDGSLWIARGERRLLEHIEADGSVTASPLPFAPISTVPADRKRFRGLPAPAELDTVTRTIAPIKGPFLEVRAAPDGHLFFWLNQPAGYSRELVAEFDRQGQLLRTFALPQGSKVVSASVLNLYTTQESTDGTWVLRRHRRP